MVNETYMRWKWAPPLDSKDGYYYQVNLTNELDNINLTDVTNDLKLEFKQLIPGARYNITVTTFTSDGTDGSPLKNSACTGELKFFSRLDRKALSLRRCYMRHPIHMRLYESVIHFPVSQQNWGDSWSEMYVCVLNRVVLCVCNMINKAGTP